MKDKLLHLICSINVPMILFVAYAIKIIIFSADFASAIVLAILSTTYVYCRHLALKEPKKRSDKFKEDFDKMSADLKEIKGVMSRVNINTITKATKKF